MGRLWVWWAATLRHKVEKDQITVGVWGWVVGNRGGKATCPGWLQGFSIG